MPLQIPVTQTGLEASIQQAMRNAGRNTQINLGTNSRQINALSQPLGRITGQADEFTKSMEAANARVFAFGASVGIINGVSKAFGALVRNTIEVEKSLVEINTVLNRSGDALQDFGNKLFDVAKTTGQTFDTVAKGALELARQGLNTEDTLKRINDALILSRLSGLDAQQSVEGLTAAFNSFKETGITTSQILNKLVVVSQQYSVSERDLIEGLKRSASVADQAGVSFDELVGIITTVQERTARGGAVIGNAFKTIFARIQDTGALQDLSNLGIQVTDLEGKVLPATRILQNLGAEFNNLSQLEQADIAKKLGGVYQLSNLLAAVKDLSSEQSKYNDIVKLSADATNEAYQKNAALNETLASLINKVNLSAQQLGATLGAIGITDSLKGLLSFFNNVLEDIQKILGEESALGTFVQGLAKGIGNVLAGPGLALFGAIIAKLSKDLIGFGIESLKSFFKIGQSAKEIASVEKAIAAALGSNLTLQRQLFALEGNRAAQLKLMTDAIVQQEAVMRRMSATAGSLAGSLYQQGVRSTGGQGLRVPQAAGGYMPAVSQESRDINRGVGGAKAGDKPVVIPNFAFGGGKKGTMVAHTGEYIIPNFAGGGSAIFNRDMVRSMGLPAGAKKIGAAGGFIPNFAKLKELPQQGYRDFNWGSFEEASKAAKDGFVTYNNAQYRISKSQFDRALVVTDKQKKVIDVASILGDDLPTILTPNQSGLSAIYTKKNIFGSGKNAEFKFESFGLQANGKQSIRNDFERKFNEDTIKNLANKTALSYARKIVSSLDSKNPIEPETLEEVDKVKGFIGSVMGAFGGIFDAAVTTGIRAASIDNDKNIENIGGDFDVNARGDARDNIIKLFGPNSIPNNGLADFKINKGKYAVKSMSEKILNSPLFANKLSKSIGVAEAINKATIKASRGYIPNFAKYIYDSDRIAPDKGATLKAVLASQVKKNLIIGPAGSGKSTLAGKMGKFLSGVSDVASASEIDILSGAARAKGGGISKNLEAIISAVNASGGKVSYLYAKNLDILSRRAGRTVAEEGDLRSKKQLKGTTYAPLNQFDFMGYVKSKSRNFNLVNGAKGFIPNFADPLKEAIGREMSAGVPASQIYVDQNSSLKNSMNPMGLMVANRRDEPAGGMQGISRARKEGANPMLYGAAGGFVPNYVNSGPGTMIGASGTSSGVPRNTPTTTTSSADIEKPKRDLLGVIFLVQTGLTLLTGATSDATSGVGKFANAVGSIASAASTVALVGQGLSGLAKEGSMASKVLGQVGIYGAIAAGAFEAFKQFASYMDSTNPAINKASEAMYRVSEAASKAAINLSNFNPAQKERIEQRREALLSGSRKIKTGQIYRGQEVEKLAEFEGVSDVLEESFNQTIDQALAVGVSYGKMWNMVREASKSGSKVTADEVNKISQEIEGLIKIAAKFKPEDFLNKFDLKPGEGMGQTLIGLSDELLKTFLTGTGDESTKGNTDYLLQYRKKLTDGLSAVGITEEEPQVKALELIVDLINQKDKAEKDAAQTAKESISSQVQETLKLIRAQELLNVRKFQEKGALNQAEVNNQERILAISSDLTLSQTQRAKKLAEQENTQARITAELEAQSQIADKLDESLSEISKGGLQFGAITDKKQIEEAVNKSKEFVNNIYKTPGAAAAISQALKGNNTELSNLITRSTELGEEYKNNEEYIKLMTTAILQFTQGEKNILNLLDQEESRRNKLYDISVKTKQNEEDRAAIVEGINYKLESKASALDFRAGTISSGQSVNQARKELETSVYERTSLSTTAEDFKKGLDQINQKYFDLEMAAEREKTALEIKSELTRSLKVDENSLKLASATTALDNLKSTTEIAIQELQKLPENIAQKMQQLQPSAALTPGIPGQPSGSQQNPFTFTPLPNISSISKAANSSIVNMGADMARLNSRFRKDFEAMAADYELQTGEKIQVTDGYRSFASQVDVKRRKPNLAATPGTSMHGFGLAIDASSDQMDKAARLGLLQKHGFYRPMMGQGGGKYEPWHIESSNVDKASLAAARSKRESGTQLGDYYNYAFRGAGLPIPATMTQQTKQGAAKQFDLSEKAYSEAVKIAALDISKIGEAAEKAAKEFLGADAPAQEITKFATSIRQAAEGFKKLGVDEAAKKEAKRLEDIAALKAMQPQTFSKGWADAVTNINKDISNFQYELGQAIPTSFSNNLSQGIQDAVTGAKSLEDALLSAASSFVQEIQSMAIKNLANTFTSSIFSGFSQGGEVKKYASGGMINGGSGNKDDVPAMLMGGEYVVKKKAVQKYGQEFLNALNNGSIQKYASGGAVTVSGGRYGSNRSDDDYLRAQNLVDERSYDPNFYQKTIDDNKDFQDFKSQVGAGGSFYAPGTQTYATIKGKENLLSYATQAYSSGLYDRMVSGNNFASVDLESESYRLTNYGRSRTDGLLGAEKGVKSQAFDLYSSQYQQEQDRLEQIEAIEKAAEEEKKAMWKSFWTGMATAAVTSVASGVAKSAASGYKAAGNKLSGIWSGGTITGADGSAVNVGGLKNYFSSAGQFLTGDFKGASSTYKLSQIGSGEALAEAFKQSSGSENKEFAKYLSSNYSYKPSGSVNNVTSNIPEVSQKTSWFDNFFKRATGGSIPQTSGIDTVPTMLSGGEFIMNRAASQNIGAGNLQSLNAGAGSLPTEEKTEELNDRIISKLDELIDKITSGSLASITINVDSAGNSTKESDTSTSANEALTKFAQQIKEQVVKVIQQEQRVGGLLY